MDDYRDLDDLVLANLRAKIAAYNKAADKFIKKCEEGQARSVVTLRELKAARAMKEGL